MDRPYVVDMLCGIPCLLGLGVRGHTVDKDMMTEALDLSYLGIFSIWNNELGTEGRTLHLVSVR